MDEKLKKFEEWINNNPEEAYLGGATVVALLSIIFWKVKRYRSKKLCKDCYSKFESGIVYDTDVAEFVEKHLKKADRNDIYKIVTATLHTHGIFEGFGGSEKIPEGKWYFFKDIK